MIAASIKSATAKKAMLMAKKRLSPKRRKEPPLGKPNRTQNDSSASIIRNHNFRRTVVTQNSAPNKRDMPKQIQNDRQIPCKVSFIRGSRRRLTTGLSGAGRRTLKCKQNARSRVHSRPLVRCHGSSLQISLPTGTSTFLITGGRSMAISDRSQIL